MCEDKVHEAFRNGQIDEKTFQLVLKYVKLYNAFRKVSDEIQELHKPNVEVSAFVNSLLYNKQNKPQKDFESDYEDYLNSFYCNECGNDHISNYTYKRTISNGEEWQCESCSTDIIVPHAPNEDNY